MNDEKQAELPAPYKEAVENGLTRYHQIVAERDAYELETRELRTQLAGYKVAMEANDTRILDQESQMQSMRLERDQAVANLAVYETFFRAQQVMMNEFVPPIKSLAKRESNAIHRKPGSIRTIIDDRSQFRDNVPVSERST